MMFVLITWHLFCLSAGLRGDVCRLHALRRWRYSHPQEEVSGRNRAHGRPVSSTRASFIAAEVNEVVRLYSSAMFDRKCSRLPANTPWTAKERSPRWATPTSSSWSTTSRRWFSLNSLITEIHINTARVLLQLNELEPFMSPLPADANIVLCTPLHVSESYFFRCSVTWRWARVRWCVWSWWRATRATPSRASSSRARSATRPSRRSTTTGWGAATSQLWAKC